MKIIKLLEGDDESETKEDLYLPEEITREIVQRLPIRSIIRWKCVSKSWRDLIEGGDFVTSHTPKLAFSCGHRHTYTVYDVEARKPLFEFRVVLSYINVPPHVVFRALINSVNGLILTCDGWTNLFVCNPITREYVGLPRLPTLYLIIGFGMSKLSGKYKILYGDAFGSYHICTLGEKSWRSISDVAFGNLNLEFDTAAFLNGNLHWLASDGKGNKLIRCFDLETELFSSLSLPHGLNLYHLLNVSRLHILEGRLCLCICFWDSLNPFKFWWMNKYGDENSWVNEYTFHYKCIVRRFDIVWPLKILANGDLLFYSGSLFIYSKKTGAVETCEGLLELSRECYSNMVSYIPNFVSLKAMGIHNVQSLSFLYPANNIKSLRFY